MTFGSLFAGIGGFDLGFERAGLECDWQVEINTACQCVLKKHWPDVARWKDVRSFHKLPEAWMTDVIVGGFPCQDISNAGLRTGISGPHSGLWSEYRKTIGVLRPHYVVVENVNAIRTRGLEVVVGDLAKLGYDAEWTTIPAWAVGSPQRRRRTFLVAYASCKRSQVGACFGGDAREELAAFERDSRQDGGQWSRTSESKMGRVVDGFPGRVDQIRMLGNSVIPQIAEFIGRRLMKMQS